MKNVKIFLLTMTIGLFVNGLQAQQMTFTGLLIQPPKEGVQELSNQYAFVIELNKEGDKIDGTSFFISPNGEFFAQMYFTGELQAMYVNGKKSESGAKMVLTEKRILKGVPIAEGYPIENTYFLKELVFLDIWEQGATFSGTWRDLGSSGVKGTFTGRFVNAQPTK